MQWSCSPAALTTMMCGQVWRFFLFSFGARPWGWWWYLILGWVQGVIILSVDIANLWKAVNRIRIILGEFGCTQIRISNSCRSKRKQVYGNLFRGLIGILTKMAKNGLFLWPHRSHFWPNFGVKGMISHDFLAQMFPKHLISECGLYFPTEKPKHIWAKIANP